MPNNHGHNARSIGEAGRLRDLDWRFLLPDPPEGAFQNLVLLGGPDGLAKRIVECGLARRVTCEPAQKRSVDALIILHGAQSNWRQAGCLLPGGWLYCEIDRRAPSFLTLTPRRLCSALQKAGLSSTGIYWVSPNFAKRQIYLPLDVPGALRWYLRTLFTASAPAQRLLELALRILAWFGSRMCALLAPCYAITAVAGPTSEARPSVLNHADLPPEFLRSRLHPVMLSSGEHDFNRVIFFPFAPGGNRPLGVLKFSRLPERNKFTENEQTVLSTIKTTLDEATRRTIPSPLGTLCWNQLSIGVESCAQGRLLTASGGRWRTRLSRRIEDLHLAANWLAEFHCQAQIKQQRWGEPELHEWIEMPLLGYEKAFGLSASEEQLFAMARKRAGLLLGTTLPIVWQHYAFGEWNIYRDNHGINVVDWESGEAGLPLFDLIYFVTHWSHAVRGLRGDAAQLRGFRQLFCDVKRDDPVSAAVHQEISRYMERLAIDRRFLPLLLVLTWVVRAPGHISRDQALGQPATNARSGNRYVHYINVLAERGERLFAEGQE